MSSVTTLFNIRIMSDALEEHDGEFSIGDKNITKLRLADDIDALAEEGPALEALVDSLDKTCTRYKMEISAEKTKLMRNSANGIRRVIKVKVQKQLFHMMDPHQGFSQGLNKPLCTTLTKLTPIWRDNNISF